MILRYCRSVSIHTSVLLVIFVQNCQELYYSSTDCVPHQLTHFCQAFLYATLVPGLHVWECKEETTSEKEFLFAGFPENFHAAK